MSWLSGFDLGPASRAYAVAGPLHFPFFAVLRSLLRVVVETSPSPVSFFLAIKDIRRYTGNHGNQSIQWFLPVCNYMHIIDLFSLNKVSR